MLPVISDSRKREGNMTFATERLSGDLLKALEENNVLAEKVEGASMCSVFRQLDWFTFRYHGRNM